MACYTIFRKKSAKVHNFLIWKHKDAIFFCGAFLLLLIEEKNFFAEISVLLRSMGTLFRPVPLKSGVFRERTCYFPQWSPSNTLQLGNALGFILLQSNTCCLCCQQLLILSKHEQKLAPQMNIILGQNVDWNFDGNFWELYFHFWCWFLFVFW